MVKWPFKMRLMKLEKKLDLGEIETNLFNNVAPKPEEFCEPYRRNTHFIRPGYVPAGCTISFFF